MKVDNDFPDVDRVLAKLRDFVSYWEQRKNTHPAEKDMCDSSIKIVDGFIDAIGKYLDSVCNADDRIARFRNTATESKEIQDMVASEDKKRTSYHSEIIINMLMIDRISSRCGRPKVFDYAEEFQENFFALLPSTVEEKSRMSERERVKRRELGNFGLYIAASVTAGMSKEYLISDEEAREFASCEDDKVKASSAIVNKVKAGSKGLKRNMDNLIK